jgi:hypothetical protein
MYYIQFLYEIAAFERVNAGHHAVGFCCGDEAADFDGEQNAKSTFFMIFFFG